jgi:hypothetical protein
MRLSAPTPACSSCARKDIELGERARVERSLREQLRAQADVIARLQRANELHDRGPVRVPTDEEIVARRSGTKTIVAFHAAAGGGAG